MTAQDLICTQAEPPESSTGDAADILNFGPGYGVSKTAAKNKRPINILDVSTDTESIKDAADTYSDDDIAIVGMAVDLPGASDTQGLWKALADELNAVSEVEPLLSPIHTSLS